MEDGVGAAARAWLRKPGHTRDELAKELGISERTLTNRLSGRHEWKWREVVTLAEKVGATLDEMAEED